MASDPPEIFARIYVRHGHRCPMSTLGGRLGMAARAHFKSCNGELKAVYGTRTCALDGIAETTGCSEQSGTLEVSSEGRHALRLIAVSGAVEIELTAYALELAGRYRALCDRLEHDWDSLDPAEQDIRRATMASALDELLPHFWHGTDEELLHVVDR